MPELETDLSLLQQELAEGGVGRMLDCLAQQLREQKKYRELFEAQQMRVRHRVGLPLMYRDLGDELDEPKRSQLEEGLLDACREVGLLLLGEGQVREGWMYLRALGRQPDVVQALAAIEPDEDNLDALVEVTLQEGLDPPRGFALVLEHYGTCNAITTYESTLGRHRKQDQQAAAGMLVEHVHQELRSSVAADIARQEGKEPTGQTLRQLVADRDWLFGEHAYHLDTTHLASTVRFSRILEDQNQLQLAVDLTEYGRRLSPQFQYPGEEPFADLYPSHALFLNALLGRDVEAAVQYFRQRAESLDVAEHGSGPVEAYLQLLDRLGRYHEAIETLLRFVAAESTPAAQVVPLLVDLSGKAGDYSAFLEFCRDREDLLGFGTALALKNLDDQPAG